MHHVWPILLILLNTVWLVLILPGLPGTWFMVVSALLLDWWRPEPLFNIWTLAMVASLAALGEVFEFFAGMGGARRAGGTRRGAVGAVLGGLIGAILLSIPVPCLGTLLGACLGAALGTVIMEVAGGMPTDTSIRVGVGAGIGRFLGTLIKLALGAVIWLVLAIAALWN